MVICLCKAIDREADIWLVISVFLLPSIFGLSSVGSDLLSSC